MKLPALTNWEATAHSLHQAAQLLGGMRMLFIDSLPNYLERAMAIKPEGLSTDPLPFGGEVILDFRQAAMVYKPETGGPALGRSPERSEGAVEGSLRERGLGGEAE
jgi:hypothetical protein